MNQKESAATHKPMRVLIVDDNDADRRLLELVLQREGHEVVGAHDGQEALQIAREEKPDLVISDILMPVMDGFALCRAWKGDERLQPIPFLFYTATYTDERDQEFGIGLGAERFLVKPEEPEALLRTLREVMQQAKAQPAATAELLAGKPDEQGAVYLKEYNEVLIRKLESKTKDLERATRDLEGDILARKRMEAALKENEQRFQALLRTIPDLVWLKDVAGVYLLCNRRFSSFFGVEEAKIVGKTDYDFVDRELADSFRAYDRAAMEKDGTSVNEEWVTFAGDGHRELLETIKTPVKDARGRLIGVLGIARDVTRRKQAEESRALLSATIEQAHEGVMITDPRGSILYVNPATEALTGYAREDLVGQNPRVLKSGLHDRTFYKALWDTVLSGGLWRGRITNRRKDGSLYVADADVAPVKSPEGKITALVATHRDVTEQIALEERLGRAMRLETIGMIAGGVAHEVRNPLNALQIMAAVLEKKQGKDPDVRQSIVHIRDQVQRLSLLMNDLLELGRPVEPEAFTLCNLALVLHDVVNDLAAIHEGARARIFVESPEGPVNVLGAPSRLMQVFANLLQNALSLSEESTEVKVEVIIEGDMAAVRVLDRGPGIAKDLLPRLFQPFQSKRKGGTGLGLAIVQKIVVDHGGTVEAANNDPGPGACFTVRLPLAR